jgi:hypothetical protein
VDQGSFRIGREFRELPTSDLETALTRRTAAMTTVNADNPIRIGFDSWAPVGDRKVPRGQNEACGLWRRAPGARGIFELQRLFYI